MCGWGSPSRSTWAARSAARTGTAAGCERADPCRVVSREGGRQDLRPIARRNLGRPDWRRHSWGRGAGGPCMRRTPGGALVVALLVAACAATPPPTPPPATPAPSAWDPRSDAIEQHAGIWAQQRPVAYAYTLDHEGADGDGYRYHVSGLEGAVQVQHLAGSTLPDADIPGVTVDGLFARARDALADPAFRVAFDDRLGNPARLTFPTAADGSA